MHEDHILHELANWQTQLEWYSRRPALQTEVEHCQEMINALNAQLEKRYLPCISI